MLNRANKYQTNSHINYMLTRGGLEKPYKIRNYVDFKIISIDKISSNG